MPDNKEQPFRLPSEDFFFALVTASDPGTYCVQISPFGDSLPPIQQGLPITSVMTDMFGFKEALLPCLGSTVLCLKGSATHCYILGTIADPDLINGKSKEGKFKRLWKTVLGVKSPKMDEKNRLGYDGTSPGKKVFANSGRPTDVVPGERVIGNEFGVLLGLFQSFATLKASELSQVQCFILDDLVRIVSHNFQHFHSLGETKIFHDGKGLHLEFGLTDNPKEAMGRPQRDTDDNSPVIEYQDNLDDPNKEENFYKLSNEKVEAVARLKGFLGKLGDFVNIMMVLPKEGLHKVDGTHDGKFDTGLNQFHVTKDGAYHLRTVSGAYIEKTNWIRVPERIRTPEDPSGDDGGTIAYEAQQAYKFNEDFKYEGQPFLYFLQIRDYLAYVQEGLAYKNFKTHTKDFVVNDNKSAETVLSDVLKVDPQTGSKFVKRTSGFYLMPNGGIMMKDAWGSAFIMEGGNIYFQPANDLVMQPLGDMIAKVGGNVAVNARRNIDLSSTEEGLRIRTEKAQHIYSKSGIVLQSDGGFYEDGYEPTNSAIERASGIVLHAPNAGVYSNAMEIMQKTSGQYILEVENLSLNNNFMEIVTNDLNIKGKNSVTINSDQWLNLYSGGGAQLLGDTFTNVSKLGQRFAQDSEGEQVEGYLTTDQVVEIKEGIAELFPEETTQLEPNAFDLEESFPNLKFRYLDSEDYAIADKAQFCIPQTVAQQEMQQFPGTQDLINWVEVEEEGTYPYPGKDLANKYVTAPLKNLESTNGEVHSKATGHATESEINATVELFQNYKVIA